MTRGWSWTVLRGVRYPAPPVEELALRQLRPGLELRPPAAKRLERKPLTLTILSLIQIAFAPRLMLRAPKGLTVTHSRTLSVRHLFLRTCKKGQQEHITLGSR